MSWPTPRAPRCLFVLFMALCAPVTGVHAQDVTEVRLKSAFLLNFARFAEWPADAFQAAARVSICVLGDRNVAETFRQEVVDKQLSGRAIAVTFVAPDAFPPACHVLYLSGIGDRRLDEVVATVRQAPVLTVSDSDAFAKRGGIIEIFVESGKMKFRINTRSAKRARIALSSRLLALAELVDEDVEAVAAESPTKPSTAIGAGAAPQTLEGQNQRGVAGRRGVWGPD